MNDCPCHACLGYWEESDVDSCRDDCGRYKEWLESQRLQGAPP